MTTRRYTLPVLAQDWSNANTTYNWTLRSGYKGSWNAWIIEVPDPDRPEAGTTYTHLGDCHWVNYGTGVADYCLWLAESVEVHGGYTFHFGIFFRADPNATVLSTGARLTDYVTVGMYYHHVEVADLIWGDCYYPRCWACGGYKVKSCTFWGIPRSATAQSNQVLFRHFIQLQLFTNKERPPKWFRDLWRDLGMSPQKDPDEPVPIESGGEYIFGYGKLEFPLVTRYHVGTGWMRCPGGWSVLHPCKVGGRAVVMELDEPMGRGMYSYPITFYRNGALLGGYPWPPPNDWRVQYYLKGD